MPTGDHPRARRVVLDTNAIDDLADESEALTTIEAAVAAESMELIVTPYQWGQVDAMSDRAKADRLRRLTTVVELPVAVWGVTAWGEAVWGDDQIAATFDDAKGEKFDKNYVDSQTLVTAQRLGVPLVTGDKHLIKKARRNGVPVMSTAEVLALAREMTPG